MSVNYKTLGETYPDAIEYELQRKFFDLKIVDFLQANYPDEFNELYYILKGTTIDEVYNFSLTAAMDHVQLGTLKFRFHIALYRIMKLRNDIKSLKEIKI